jgi:prepilin-type N-terminal cleavage/methylation domain-containing protein
MTMRCGYSMIELLMALSLAGLVSTAALALLHGQSRLAHSTSDSADAAETLRTATQVLSAETRWHTPALDVRAMMSDSLSLRAFRGSGVVCAVDPAYGGIVRYRGLRDPDPSKDSVLIERGANTELNALVLGVVTTGAVCDSLPAIKLAVNQTLNIGDVIIVFESGNYYLSGGALRYRLGAGGRQPVTAAVLDDARSGFDTVPGAWSVQLGLAAQRGRGSANVRVRLPFAQEP